MTGLQWQSARLPAVSRCVKASILQTSVLNSTQYVSAHKITAWLPGNFNFDTCKKYEKVWVMHFEPFTKVIKYHSVDVFRIRYSRSCEPNLYSGLSLQADKNEVGCENLNASNKLKSLLLELA